MARMTPTEARAKIQSLQPILRARGEGAADRKISAVVTTLTAAAGAGLPPAEVAAAAGVSAETVRQWARGRSGSKDAWPELAAALKTAGFAGLDRGRGGQTSGLFRQGREPAAAKAAPQAQQEAPTAVARPRWAKGPAKPADAVVTPECVVDATLSVDQEDGSILARIRPRDHRYVDFVREFGRGHSITARGPKVERRQG